jgi:hypothetical protein
VSCRQSLGGKRRRPGPDEELNRQLVSRQSEWQQRCAMVNLCTGSKFQLWNFDSAGSDRKFAYHCIADVADEQWDNAS